MPVRKNTTNRSAAKKTTPARRTPAKKAAPAKPAPKVAPKAAPAKETPVARTQRVAKASPSKPSIQAHDVLRAFYAVEVAKADAVGLLKAYFEEYGEVLDEAVAHSERVLSEYAPPVKRGRPSNSEGPARKARSQNPVMDEFFDLDKVQAMGVLEVRKLAADLIKKGLITEPKIKRVIIEQMEEKGLFRESASAADDEGDEDSAELPEDFDEDELDEDDLAGETEEDDDADDDDEDGEDEDAGDDGEGDGEESYSLAELKAMDLKELQDVAEDYGIPWKGKKQAALLQAILDASQEPDEDDEEDDDEEDDEEELELSEDDILEMSVSELTKLLTRMQVRIPVKSKNNQEALAQLVLENLAVDDEEDDDEE